MVRYDALDFNDNYFFDRNNQLTFCLPDGWEEVEDDEKEWHEIKRGRDGFVPDAELEIMYAQLPIILKGRFGYSVINESCAEGMRGGLVIIDKTCTHWRKLQK